MHTAKRILTCLTVLVMTSVIAIPVQAIALDNANPESPLTLSESSTENPEFQTQETESPLAVAVGSRLKWSISQKVNYISIDSLTRYFAMTFEDTLPKEVKFESATLTGAGGVDVTYHAGVVQYDEHSNIVRYVFHNWWLQSYMPMVGETYTFSIIAKVVGYPADNTIVNRATTKLNNLVMSTNETITEIYRAGLQVEKNTPIDLLTPNLSGEGEIEFNSKIVQTEQRAAVKELTVIDEMPDELHFKIGSLVASNKFNENVPFRLTETESGFTAVFERLNYGDELNLRFICNVTELALGKSVCNTIKVHGAGVDEISATSTSVYVRDTVTPRTANIGFSVPADNLKDGHGDAIFVAVIEGVDVEGRLRTYRGIVALNSDSTVLDNEMAYAVCTIKNIAAGEYEIRELLPSRYTFTSLENPSSTVTIDGRTAHANLLQDFEASCDYSNNKTRWDFLSDTDFAVNSFPGGSK